MCACVCVIERGRGGGEQPLKIVEVKEFEKFLFLERIRSMETLKITL